MKLRIIIGIALIVGLSFGCKTSTLAPGGAYNISTTNIVTGAVTNKPDITFFAIDSAFDLAYKTVDGIFLFEQQNRDALWAISPDIKHALDKARPVASNIVQRYVVARAAYMANSSSGNLTSLQGILDEIKALSTSIQTALPKPKQ